MASDIIVTPQMVRDLRELTGVGMMECKDALKRHNGDMTAAQEYLRTKGFAVVTRRLIAREDQV